MDKKDFNNIIIESKRLKLVSLRDKYAEELFKEFTDEITQYMLPRASKRIEETQEYISSSIQKMKKGEELGIVILHKETEEFLGGGGLHEIHTGMPFFGIWIKKSAHGNTYGREAVHALKQWADRCINYTYLRYPVDKRNIPSRKIAESLGVEIFREFQQTNRSGNILDKVEYRIYKF